MASKKETKAPVAAAAKGKPAKKGGKLGFFTTMIMFGLALPFIKATVVLLLLGMLPTIIALITDSDRQKSSAIAIGSLNFAGVVPFVIDLWMKGQNMDTVFHILREPTNWVVMLGAAGVGQLVVFAVPPVLASLTTARYELRLKTLKENLESLKATWGPDVANTKSLDKSGAR